MALYRANRKTVETPKITSRSVFVLLRTALQLLRVHKFEADVALHGGGEEGRIGNTWGVGVGLGRGEEELRGDGARLGERGGRGVGGGERERGRERKTCSSLTEHPRISSRDVIPAAASLGPHSAVRLRSSNRSARSSAKPAILVVAPSQNSTGA